MRSPSAATRTQVGQGARHGLRGKEGIDMFTSAPGTSRVSVEGGDFWVKAAVEAAFPPSDALTVNLKLHHRPRRGFQLL